MYTLSGADPILIVYYYIICLRITDSSIFAGIDSPVGCSDPTLNTFSHHHYAFLPFCLSRIAKIYWDCSLVPAQVTFYILPVLVLSQLYYLCQCSTLMRVWIPLFWVRD